MEGNTGRGRTPEIDGSWTSEHIWIYKHLKIRQDVKVNMLSNDAVWTVNTKYYRLVSTGALYPTTTKNVEREEKVGNSVTPSWFAWEANHNGVVWIKVSSVNSARGQRPALLLCPSSTFLLCNSIEEAFFFMSHRQLCCSCMHILAALQLHIYASDISKDSQRPSSVISKNATYRGFPKRNPFEGHNNRCPSNTLYKVSEKRETPRPFSVYGGFWRYFSFPLGF